MESNLRNLQTLSLLSVLAIILSACPNQELAPLTPCTIASASIDAAQSGVNKVDLLFVVDNSGSMSEEQVKLSKQLPRLVRVLATGDLDGVANADGKTDFTPVSSLHLGVVSSDLGVNGQSGVVSCGNASFQATDQRVGGVRAASENKPHGDEGKLLHSTAVALSGVSIPESLAEPNKAVQVIAPRPECGNVSVPKFIDFKLDTSNPEDVARSFGCVAQLGVNGCGNEQQLESMWRALAPSSNNSFSGGSAGQGDPAGYNASFLREDAVLVVILVSDEEDCSSPDESRNRLYVPSAPPNSAQNVLCTRNADALHPVDRYIQGLKSLKPAGYQDRIIFAGIVGVPTADQTANKTLDEILMLPAMTTQEDGAIQPRVRPACSAGDAAGRADPARRIVEVAKGFGTNGVITSICEDDYGAALDTVIERIAAKLSGACLPRQLKVNAHGFVECSVIEIKSAEDDKPCADTPGRKSQTNFRMVGDSKRIVCEVDQLAVRNRSVPSGRGWYYDNFSAQVMKDCPVDRQRIAFADAAPLSTGATAQVVCQQSVLNAAPDARGAAAINTSCADNGGGAPQGDAKCSLLDVPPGELLICVDGTCQLKCDNSAGCQPGFVCTTDGLGRGYCTNPTCPISEPADLPDAGATVPAGS